MTCSQHLSHIQISADRGKFLLLSETILRLVSIRSNEKSLWAVSLQGLHDLPTHAGQPLRRSADPLGGLVSPA